MGTHRLQDLEEVKISRFSSTFDELDWLYGRKHDWGIVCGAISLWIGGGGVGKTRLLVEMAKQLDSGDPSISTLFFQGELDPAGFKSEKLSGYIPKSNIWISEDISIDDQINRISELKPGLVITDSVQQIEEYQNGRGAKDIVRKLREVIRETATHVIFISQVTNSGTARGGTVLGHEVDIVCHLEKSGPMTPSMFILSCPDKNRYGKTGKEVIFCHKDWGVDCQSFNRMSCDDWTESLGIYKREQPIEIEKSRGFFRRALDIIADRA